ncbi:L,D-transpeptidase [Methylocystis parvus]|uniref:L,D-transpeptidase n=1 Tax=Methylocystis parvus TaxID=134 RepID=UPI003C7299EC
MLRSLACRSVVAGVITLIAAPQPGLAGDVVAFSSPAPPGAIVIVAPQRKLYFVLTYESAVRYPIAVPKSGREWSGNATVNGKFVYPDWAPPPCVKADHPELPDFIPGGAPNNPMGARAITLDRFEVAIHGTTAKMRRSIGTAASYGCIRMLNEDVIDLFNRIDIGTPVLMIR